MLIALSQLLPSVVAYHYADCQQQSRKSRCDKFVLVWINIFEFHLVLPRREHSAGEGYVHIVYLVDLFAIDINVPAFVLQDGEVHDAVLFTGHGALHIVIAPLADVVFTTVERGRVLIVFIHRNSVDGDIIIGVKSRIAEVEFYSSRELFEITEIDVKVLDIVETSNSGRLILCVVFNLYLATPECALAYSCDLETRIVLVRRYGEFVLEQELLFIR